MSAKPKPLPCPFCGCRPKIAKAHVHDGYRTPAAVVACEAVRCALNPKTYPCSIHGQPMDRAAAIAAWNGRAAK